jgi:hypothetical protein
MRDAQAKQMALNSLKDLRSVLAVSAVEEPEMQQKLLHRFLEERKKADELLELTDVDHYIRRLKSGSVQSTDLLMPDARLEMLTHEEQTAAVVEDDEVYDPTRVIRVRASMRLTSHVLHGSQDRTSHVNHEERRAHSRPVSLELRDLSRNSV